MGMNPMMLLQMQNIWKQFAARHPKLPMFFQAVGKSALEENTVFELKVTRPDGTSMVTNMKLTKEDIQAFDQVQAALKGGK